MTEKSLVYWCPPYEISGIKHTKQIMVTNNLVKTRLILDEILDNINSGDKVAVKVHVGESGNTRYLRHDYVREVVRAIKVKGGVPTLIETQGLGVNPHKVSISDDYILHLGCRRTADNHERVAHFHGYTESIIGAPLEFIDGEKGLDARIVEIDGIHFKDVSVAAHLFNFDKMVVISHFKGHAQAGFGGALKQLGIGCITKRNKFRAHVVGDMKINKKKCNPSACDQECIEACPTNSIQIEGDSAVIEVSTCVGCGGCTESCKVKKAIKRPGFADFKLFCERVIDNAKAVIDSFGAENIRYINFATDVTLMCDCVVNPSMPIIPDLGIFGSKDPVAVDRACIDAETNAPGLPVLKKDRQWTEPISPGIEKFHAMMTAIDPAFQFEASLKNKIGTTDYELVNILK